jgi:hypothetical protein
MCPMAYDVYRITIKGHLDPEWSDRFDGLTITLEAMLVRYNNCTLSD